MSKIPRGKKFSQEDLLDEEEKEKMKQIDWYDFVLVETIDFSDDEEQKSENDENVNINNNIIVGKENIYNNNYNNNEYENNDINNNNYNNLINNEEDATINTNNNINNKLNILMEKK